MDDELAAGVAFFTSLRLIIGGLYLADQICQKPCAIKQQRLSQTFLQAPDIACRTRGYILEGVLEEDLGFPAFFI